MGKIKDLDKCMETKTYGPIYVFYGEEKGLITEYLNDIKTHFSTIIESEDLQEIIKDSNFNPIWGGKKLYLMKYCEMFEKKAEDEFINFLVRMMKQKTHTIIFIEDKVDGTLKQTQALADTNKIEFQSFNEDQLIMLTQQILKQHEKTMVKDVARYFVDLCDYKYSNITNELNKLVNYVSEKQISVDHVKQCVSRNTNTVVFDLVTYIVKENYSRALDMYDTLILRKESPLGVLTLIYRQLKLLYQIKLLKTEGYTAFNIAEACDSKPFIIEKNMNICNFDSDKLLRLMFLCDEYDYKIKSGAIKDALAVKMLILRSSIRR